jgi:hypothetical protein
LQGSHVILGKHELAFWKAESSFRHEWIGG